MELVSSLTPSISGSRIQGSCRECLGSARSKVTTRSVSSKFTTKIIIQMSGRVLRILAPVLCCSFHKHEFLNNDHKEVLPSPVKCRKRERLREGRGQGDDVKLHSPLHLEDFGGRLEVKFSLTNLRRS